MRLSGTSPWIPLTGTIKRDRGLVWVGETFKIVSVRVRSSVAVVYIRGGEALQRHLTARVFSPYFLVVRWTAHTYKCCSLLHWICTTLHTRTRKLHWNAALHGSTVPFICHAPVRKWCWLRTFVQDLTVVVFKLGVQGPTRGLCWTTRGAALWCDGIFLVLVFGY